VKNIIGNGLLPIFGFQIIPVYLLNQHFRPNWQNKVKTQAINVQNIFSCPASTYKLEFALGSSVGLLSNTITLKNIGNSSLISTKSKHM
jgi:hypothetical protein